jgi:ABC-type molybdate transport system permease subunit
VQVPEVDAVRVAEAVALLNVQPDAVKLITEYVTAPLSVPPVVEKVGTAVYAVPFHVEVDVTCEATRFA